jgi:hypothetical protein
MSRWLRRYIIGNAFMAIVSKPPISKEDLTKEQPAGATKSRTLF